MLNIQVSQKSRTLMLNSRVEQNCLFTETTGAAVDRQRQFLTQNSNKTREER